MDNKKYYIYKITNTTNNKIYIGKTVNPDKRWRDHIWTSNNPKASQYSIVHNAIAKYGHDKFTFEIIAEYLSETECYDAEEAFIEKFQSRKYGYNIAQGGLGGYCGVVPSLESKEKSREFHKTRARKPMSDETKAKIKQARAKQKKLKLPIDLKNKILNVYRENKHTKPQLAEMFGLEISTITCIIRKGVGKDKFIKYTMTDEQKETQRKNGIGRKHSPETLVKISKARKGIKRNRPHSLEHRAKISDALKGRNKIAASKIITNETRAKSADTINRRGLLSDEQKLEIIELYASGNYTRQQLADKFNVEWRTVNYVISKVAKRGILTEEEKTRNRSNAHKGKKLSEEHRRKISIGNMGRAPSDETKVKLSESKLGRKNGMHNRSHSIESKAKMSECQRARKRRAMTIEEKENLRKKLKGRKNVPIDKNIKQAVLNDWNSGAFTKKMLAEKYSLLYNSIVGIIRKA